MLQQLWAVAGRKKESHNRSKRRNTHEIHRRRQYEDGGEADNISGQPANLRVWHAPAVTGALAVACAKPDDILEAAI